MPPLTRRAYGPGWRRGRWIYRIASPDERGGEPSDGGGLLRDRAGKTHIGQVMRYASRADKAHAKVCIATVIAAGNPLVTG